MVITDHPPRIFGSAFLAAALVALLLTSPASAAGACSRTGSTVFVDLGAAAEADSTFRKGTDGVLELAHGGSADDCDGATPASSNLILVSDGNGRAVRFTLDNGGMTANMHFQVSLRDGTDTFTLLGTNGNDALSVGTSASAFGDTVVADTDGDGSANVELFEVESFAVHGLGGNDRLSGSPGKGLEPLSRPLTLLGSGGDDALVGGRSSDMIKGGSGKDMLSGEFGNDRLLAGSGTDRCKGGPGADRMKGCERKS
jgi:Ca2+-binding RTX toxin-like protein